MASGRGRHWWKLPSSLESLLGFGRPDTIARCPTGRGIGDIAAALSLLMISPTPVMGTRYIVDVFAGIVLAATSIWAAKLHLGWSHATRVWRRLR